jgi:NAD(P)-dependent dehydrogenase (short-subunit alcohol dehydrogenase family)
MVTTSESRVALITGGAKGIGAEVAARLAASGHTVLVADLDSEAAKATARELQATGCSARAMQLDVGKPDSITAVFGEIDREHGRCDILVNCAGIAKVFPFLDFPLDNFLATMNVNVTGTLLCSQAAARLMLKRGWGRIVNIASVAGMRAVGSGRTAYGTSKGAVIALTRQMAVELAEHGITANAVSPGPVDTPMTQVLHTAKFREEYSKAIPMNRYGTCGEIASAVMYLVSDDARYVTGISMPIDGGFLASGARGI